MFGVFLLTPLYRKLEKKCYIFFLNPYINNTLTPCFTYGCFDRLISKGLKGKKICLDFCFCLFGGGWRSDPIFKKNAFIDFI